MKVGTTIPSMVAGLDRETMLAWMRQVDAGPYSTLAVGERITFPNQELMVTMAAAAAVTERVGLALTVVVLPLHSAVLIAKQTATLDVLSRGRLTVGVGIGGREEDYRAVGAAFERRMARMEAQVAVMRRAWAGEAVVPDAAPVGPTPYQLGGPAILAGVLRPGGVTRAARFADGLCGFTFGADVAEVMEMCAHARCAWAEQGRATPPRLVTSCWYALGERGREQMDAYVARYFEVFGRGVGTAVSPMCTVTSATELRRVLRELPDSGVDELILVPTTSDINDVARVADLIG